MGITEARRGLARSGARALYIASLLILPTLDLGLYYPSLQTAALCMHLKRFFALPRKEQPRSCQVRHTIGGLHTSSRRSSVVPSWPQEATSEYVVYCLIAMASNLIAMASNLRVGYIVLL